MTLPHYVFLNTSSLYLYYVFTSANRHQKQLLFCLCRIHVKLKIKSIFFQQIKTLWLIKN